jgi:NAD(P)H-dependent flavin oxidoreductase YrpB (nitropropane dioxygenase family)
MSLWAGQSVGLVSKVQSAAEIVHEIAEEAEVTLRRLAQ